MNNFTVRENMTAEEIKKLVFHLDGLRYSFQMSNLVSRRIGGTLDEIARNHPDSYTEEQVTSALLDAWILIDICHRVRGIAQGMPGLSRKLSGIQIFLRGTEQIESLRDYVQHFRNEIPNIPLESNPLWGVLSWTPTFDKTKAYSIFSGKLVGGVTGHSLTFDVNNAQFVTEIRLQANGINVNLVSVSKHLVKLKDCISAWLDQLEHPKVERVKGKTLVLSVYYKK